MATELDVQPAGQIAAGGLAAAARRIRLALSAAVAAVLGLLPHVLHHAGPFAGAAILGGVGGSVLFGLLGLVLSVPFLLRVHRHCGNWRTPGLLLATFAIVFSLSTFVIGPAITNGGDGAGDKTPAPAPRSHEQHHR